ncbi:hypothetical protein F4861DRAFT_224595 [Xylaria intraflava]|nr:hypothetical protein F4861DRAFT_224595 [Xylaria intraflava]
MESHLIRYLDLPVGRSHAYARPQILPGDQETLLELLCSLLSPLGHYRSQHVHPSKGGRAKKRKRKEQSDQRAAPPVPPVPELQLYVDIGLSSVSRYLQKTVSDSHGSEVSPQGQASEERPGSRFYSVIFVARSGQPNALSCHLPQMVAVASQCQSSQPPIRIVELPRACEGRLSEALGIPRVSCVGICVGAPNSTALVDFAREHVPIIEVPWLQEANHAEYRATNIKSIETFIGTRKKAKGQKIR